MGNYGKPDRRNLNEGQPFLRSASNEPLRYFNPLSSGAQRPDVNTLSPEKSNIARWEVEE